MAVNSLGALSILMIGNSQLRTTGKPSRYRGVHVACDRNATSFRIGHVYCFGSGADTLCSNRVRIIDRGGVPDRYRCLGICAERYKVIKKGGFINVYWDLGMGIVDTVWYCHRIAEHKDHAYAKGGK